MPATTRISVPVKQTPPKTEIETTSKTPAFVPRSKTRAMPRRRARRREDEATDSEEELVREPRSDSEDGTAESSEIDSEVSESESEDEPDSQPHVDGAAQFDRTTMHSEPSSPAQNPSTSQFIKPHDWFDAVTEEARNGAAPLPVVDFAEMASQDHPTSPAVNPVPSPPPSDAEKLPTGKGISSKDKGWVKRKPGESARQAYLNRLSSDPAYVPTVGQFWSHDDRLLDKDLRSLSGWWRGRWQGRGRGMRGRGSFRARGRGGFASGGIGSAEAPFVEHAWTHDGFEELNGEQEQGITSKPWSSYERGNFFRGRGGRGRGFFGRGGFTSAVRSASPQGSLQAATDSHRSAASLQFGDGTRPWFAMKPERVWTKQSENYLFMDSQLKPMYNQGLGQGVRIKLPPSKTQESKEPVVVRLPVRFFSTARKASIQLKDQFTPNAIAVKLPTQKRAGKEPEITVEEDVVTVQPPPMDDAVLDRFPQPQLPNAIPPPKQTIIPSSSTQPVSTSEPMPSKEAPTTFADQSTSSTMPVFGTPDSSETTWTQVQTTEQPPSFLPQHQMQVQMHPVGSHFQPPSSYAPYAYPPSGVSLPAGIGMLENGVAYEIATGRTVYLQTPPPPPPPSIQMPLYNPRPISMHPPHGSVHFLTHHGPSMSMSASPPAFMHTPPLFSLPRQSSRVEIKAPGEEKGKGRDMSHSRSASQPRPRYTANVNAEPFTPASQASVGQNMEYYDARAFEDVQRHQQMFSHGHQFYYPVGTPNGTSPYGYGQQYEGNPYAPDAYGQETYASSSNNYY